MKEPSRKKLQLRGEQVAWGVTAFCVIALSILFYLFLTRLSTVSAALDKLKDIMMPVIIGIAMAYILLPVYNGICRLIYRRTENRLGSRAARKLSRVISTVISHLLLVVVVTGLIMVAGPQLWNSIISVVRDMPSNIDRLTALVEKVMKNDPERSQMIMDAIENVETRGLSWLQENLLPSVNNILTGITTGVVSLVGFIMDALIGIIVSIYILNSKELFAAQAKKIIYSIFSIRRSNRLIRECREVHRIFSGFISGKILDSLIIGLITFVVLTVMHMPYAVMVSVVVGVTNIIPFFGPFIGAIPCTLIILTADPLKAVQFLIFVVVIQTIDGNVIGPKILGDSTGLPSFWVLFAILIGGGLFGFAGMVLGVPVFATLYLLVNRLVSRSLRRRRLPEPTSSYIRLESMDTASRRIRNGHIPLSLFFEDEEADPELAEETEIPKRKRRKREEAPPDLPSAMEEEEEEEDGTMPPDSSGKDDASSQARRGEDHSE